ncbi:arginase family protein [Cedecea neteri]|uniref:arginase family protein n=1 Tax=Cedecea neteri TaxID=158822 RepID=UPI002AA6A8A3|nr:arginase family protein [Cedecea neteri]WPU25441.1 arginase family protein [Cedecea neteri]
MRSYTIIEAPSVLGHIPTHLGVAKMPDSFRQNGFTDLIGAKAVTRVESPRWRAERDAETQMMNPTEINQYSVQLADAVGQAIEAGDFPVVIGGDCSIILGNLLALRRRGRYGIFYVDGHTDFYRPDLNPILGAASASDLYFITGRGPDIVSNIEGLRPLVRDEDVAVFGYRDGATQVHNRCEVLPESMMALNRNQVRILGTETAAEDAVAFLTREDGPEGYWIHIDADCLDQSIMWACDAPQPDGFMWDDLATIIRVAMSSPKAIGLQLTIYNPDMDPDGLAGRGFARTVGKALAAARENKD